MATKISSNGKKLSNSGYHRSGKTNWWLKGADGFVEIPRVRGDDEFEADVDLAPGRYTLGTGRDRDAIRIAITVE